MSRPARDADILSLGEALARLQSSRVLEEFAQLTGRSALVVDLPAAADAPAGFDDAALECARERLGQLACPSIALRGRELSAGAEALLPAFDLVVRGSAELEGVRRGLERNPQAGLALVQLLRHNERANVHDGLIAESLVYSVLQSGRELAAWLAGHEGVACGPNDEPAVRVERKGGRLSLELNRPERHNAFGLEIRDALVEALELANDDETIESVVLRGRGRSFCSGGDLAEFGHSTDPVTAHLVRSTRNPARLLAGVAAKTRVQLHGACIGAGIELPAFAAHVVARPDAYFELPEVGMGLVPGAGGTVSIPRRIGRQRCAWMALTGERIDSERALRWGLVDEIADERTS